jgi:predicted ribosomally synthesized peptide with SipW-like signal peptide
MKKILVSLSIIGAVAAIVVGGTIAYFSDTQTSTGNTFTAGTIDITVGSQGVMPVKLDDMKPSQVGYSNFTVTNSGTNPVNVTKTIQNIQTSENGINEPECKAEEGTWMDQHCNGYTEKKDIDSVITYDLSVKVYDNHGVLAWNQTLNDMDQTIAQKNNQPSFLGMIPAGWHMDVTESYHMKADTGNWAQSDQMTFDILLTGTQLTGTATLSNKDPNRPVTDGWFVLGTKTGTLTYGVKDATFNYTFTGTAPLVSTGYSLVMYEEPFSTPNSATIWPRPVIILGAGTTDGTGAITITGNLNTGDMLNAKIWLVKTNDLTGSTLSGWNPSAYLFDTGMIDYYDSAI